MKVYIGGYRNWFGPYQLAELIKSQFGLKRTNKNSLEFHISVMDLADKFARFDKVFQWIHDKFFQRVVIVKIDKYDTWNMDSTLAYIIHPMLVQLKETKHGYFFVDDEDVPEDLGIRSTDALRADTPYEWDINAEARCDWVIDELIWVFGEYNKEDFEHSERAVHALKMFGKYYSGLWD